MNATHPAHGRDHAASHAASIGIAWRAARAFVALFFAAFGLALVAGGIKLIAVGGSWYYAITGACLIASAVLLFLGRASGQVLMAVLWGASMLWALWEVGLDAWGLVPRVVCITVLLILALLVSPALRVPFRVKR